MIAANSRYANAQVISAQNIDKKDVQVIVFAQPSDTTITYVLHQVTGTDTIDGLSQRYYSDPTLWWQIANANPEIMNWSVLVTGSLLRIPTINGLL